jgi:hypothetical protein
VVTPSTEMDRSEDVDVPIGWWWAEHVAEDLIAAHEGPVSPATFQFRATRDVLALTLFLTGTAGKADDLPASYLELIADRLCDAADWLAWCRSRLGRQVAATGVADADLAFARNAWRWLGRSRMLAGLDVAGRGCDDALASCLGAGCRIGLHQARRIVGGRLTGGS